MIYQVSLYAWSLILRQIVASSAVVINRESDQSSTTRPNASERVEVKNHSWTQVYDHFIKNI